MPQITFLGAGSTVFAKSVLGDCMLTEDIKDLEISLHDIDPVRLDDSYQMLLNLSRNIRPDTKIRKSLDRREALRGSKYVVNAIQVGGYEPCTVTDFEIPKKFGLRQTIADTLGIGGIFRALRTIPVLHDFADDINAVCPDAVFLNYTNPMAMLMAYFQSETGISSVGLCHSVQSCVPDLLKSLRLEEFLEDCRWEIAGINHQAWLLKCEDRDGNDLYPEIKRRAYEVLGGSKDYEGIENGKRILDASKDSVRFEIMRRFGFYVTESSEHNAEYLPWFIKRNYPELIDRYRIPLDEYPRRCVRQIERWESMRAEVVANHDLSHERTKEYASYIIAAMESDTPFRVHGNLPNTMRLIPNLPENACVEVPCMVDRSGFNPCYVGSLPEQCAALNRTNIGVQLMTVQAAKSLRKEDVYRAALLDPHTSAELSIDDTVAMCDELFAAHKGWLPDFK